ncbi:MAG: hypothetical protein ACFWUK_10405 [Serratia liquefaciens]
MGQMFKLTTLKEGVIGSSFHYADNQVDLNGNKMSLQEFIMFGLWAPRRKTAHRHNKRKFTPRGSACRAPFYFPTYLDSLLLFFALHSSNILPWAIATFGACCSAINSLSVKLYWLNTVIFLLLKFPSQSMCILIAKRVSYTHN